MNTAVEVWKTTLSLLEQEMTPTAVRTWFADLEPLSLDEDRFILYCPNEWRCTVIRNRYIPTLEKALFELFSTNIHVAVVDENQRKNLSFTGSRNSIMGTDRYTFSRYVVGDSNRMAYAAAKAVAETPGEKWNPLFLYGDSGLGKTHLLYAIYHQVRSAHPEYNIVFVKGEQFLNELTDAIRDKTTDIFRSRYRGNDMLLVDDIQFIAGKEAAQTEFFNTFNDLYENGRQIVLVSDRHPSDMIRLEERLRSRFEWGLIQDISAPDYETRLVIVQEKAQQLDLDLPMPLLEYIAQNITGNVRQLEGVVKKMLAYYEMGGNMDLDAVMRALRDLLQDKQAFSPSPSVIVEETCKCYGVMVTDILSNAQNKEVVIPRQVAMYIVRELTQLSLPEIGKIFDRDHSTVIYALKKIGTQQTEDQELAEMIRDIKTNINSRNY